MPVDRILNFIALVRRSWAGTVLFAALLALGANYIFGWSYAQSFCFGAGPIVLRMCSNTALYLFSRTCQVFLGGLFWGFLAMVAAQHVFGLSDNQSTFFVGLPIGLILAVLLWVKLPWPDIPGRAGDEPLHNESSSRE